MLEAGGEGSEAVGAGDASVELGATPPPSVVVVGEGPAAGEPLDVVVEAVVDVVVVVVAEELLWTGPGSLGVEAPSGMSGEATAALTTLCAARGEGATVLANPAA